MGHFGRFSEKNSNTLGLGCYYLVGRIYIVEPILHLKMGIDQYFAAKDQVERISATIDQAIAKMAYTLSAHTNSDGLADHRKLKGEASRRELADKIEGILFEYAKDLTKSTLNPSNPEDFMRLSSSTYGLFGFSKEDVLKYVDLGYNKGILFHRLFQRNKDFIEKENEQDFPNCSFQKRILGRQCKT